jgi:hypothetical protein
MRGLLPLSKVSRSMHQRPWPAKASTPTGLGGAQLQLCLWWPAVRKQARAVVIYVP